MPYAHYGRVSTGQIAGGVEISSGEYTSALAAMTSQGNPKQVSIAGGTFALVSRSLPIEFSLPMDDAVTLPAITGEGTRTPINTGICRHPSGSGWLIGDANAGTPEPRDAGVIFYDDNWVQQGRFRWLDYGLSGACQGVDSDPRDGSIWAVANAIGTVIQIDAASGNLIKQFSGLQGPNGIALIPELGQFMTYSGGGFGGDGRIYRYSMADGSQIGEGYQIPGVGSGQADHIHYLGNGKMLLTYDAVESGVMLAIDVSTGSPSIERMISPEGADAIEGVCVHNNRLYLCNDAGFHVGDPPLNRILEYDVQGLF